VFSGEDGKQEPRCWSSGVLFRQPSCQNEDNDELDLRSHDPLPLSKAVYARAWRFMGFMGKLFCGLGFAATAIAGRCFISARAAIAGRVIAARSAGGMRGGGKVAPRTGVISGASRGGWIIATDSAPIVAVGRGAA
jgi:hypothetical protein